jgi:hypothetical protein
LEQILPFAASAVLAVVSLVRFIVAVSKKRGKKEIIKSAVLFVLAAALLAVLTVSGLDMIIHYISSALWLILGIR